MPATRAARRPRLAARLTTLAVAAASLVAITASPAPADELTGPPDPNGNWAYCNVAVSSTDLTNLDERTWSWSCQYGPTTATVSRIGLRFHTTTGSGPYTINQFSSTRNSNGKFRASGVFTDFGINGTINLASVTCTSITIAGTARPCRYLTAAVGSSAPEYPFDYWPGGTPGEGVPDAQARGGGLHGWLTTIFRSDPVNTATGAFFHSSVDVVVPGRGVPFTFGRSYNSSDPNVGADGLGWAHSLSAHLVEDVDGDITFFTEDGQEVVYTPDGSGGYDRPPAVTSQLVATTSGFELTRRDLVTYEFDQDGRLVALEDDAGDGLALAYEGSGRLDTVTDDAGRVHDVSYDGAGHLTGVTTADGRSVSYGYTGDLMTSFTDVRGKSYTYTYDGGNRLASIVDPNGNTVVGNTYGANGRVVDQVDSLGNHSIFAWDGATGTSTLTDAAGKQWVDVYDGNVLIRSTEPAGTTKVGFDGDLNPIKWTDARGNVTRMTYDAAGQLLTRRAPLPLDYLETWTYDSEGRVATYTDGRNKTTGYTYTAAGHPLTTTRPDDSEITYGYNASGELTSITDAATEITTLAYDAAGNVNSMTSPEGRVTSFTYDNAGRRTSVVSPRGNVAGADPDDHRTIFAYDAAGHVTSVTDPLGSTTTSTYDDAGNLLTVSAPLSGTTTYTYNDANEVETVTAPDGGVTEYGYDARGKLTSVTSPEGEVTTYTYKPQGWVATIVDPAGNAPGGVPAEHTWSFGYDADGNATSATDPLGKVTQRAYDALNRVVSVTDANTHTTEWSYDAASNVTAVEDPLGNVTGFGYDDLGRMTTRTDPRTKVWGYGYDPVGRLLSTTDPLGNEATSEYDGDGLLVRRVDPRGNAAGADPSDYDWVYEYDPDGNLLSETDPTGAVTEHTVDARGLVTETTDGNDHTTGRTYDAAGRLEVVTAPGGATTTYGYDLMGQVVSVTDALDRVTEFDYDLQGRLLSRTSPTLRVRSMTYGDDGRLATRSDSRGTASFAYDRAGRLTGIGYSDATPDVTFGYDDVGNRTSMTDGKGTVSYGYDAADRLTSVTRGMESFTYEYDGASNVTERNYPDGTSLVGTFDDASRLATVTAGGATTEYVYDPAGRLASTTWPAGTGLVESRSYDASGRASGISTERDGTVVVSTDVTRDAVGNPVQVEREDGSSTAFDYDVRDRLTDVCSGVAVCGTSSDIEYGYDAVGNRLTETRAAGVTSYDYDDEDQLMSVDPPAAPAVSYGYDGAGNQTSAGPVDFTYDLENRMTSVKVPVPSYASTVLGGSPLGYWRLGEASGVVAGDASGGAGAGTYENGAVLGAGGLLTGDSDTAASLDGTDDAVRLPDLDLEGGSFTLEAWIKPDATASEQETIFEIREDGALGTLSPRVCGNGTVEALSGRGMFLRLHDDGTLRLAYFDGAQLLCSDVLTAAGTVSRGSTHHVVVTYDAGSDTSKIYVDGVLKASGTQGPLTATGGTHLVGRSSDLLAANPFGGVIDEVAAWERVLSADEVALHSARGRKSPSHITTTYGYDGDGMRLEAVTASEAPTRWWWDVNAAMPRLAVESNGAAGTEHSFLYGGGLPGPTGFRTDGEAYSLHSDHVGSVLGVFDGAGAQQWSYEYEPFGTVTAADALGAGAPANPFGFAGEYTDPTGLVHLRARQYDPALGRFTSVDPLEAAFGSPSPSAYVYGANNPLRFVDPLGLRATGADSGCDPAVLMGLAPVVLQDPAAGSSPWACEEEEDNGGGGAWWNPFDDWDHWKSVGAGRVDAYYDATGDIPGGLDLFNVAVNPAYRALDSCTGQVTGFNGWECAAASLETIETGWTGALVARGMLGIFGQVPQAALSTPTVGSTKLQNIVDDLYKGTTNPGRVGTGTTADALRYELNTGQQVFGKSHLQKVEDSLRGLENWLKANPSAPYHDRLVARSLADDLLDALGQVQ